MILTLFCVKRTRIIIWYTFSRIMGLSLNIASTSTYFNTVNTTWLAWLRHCHNLSTIRRKSFKEMRRTDKIWRISQSPLQAQDYSVHTCVSGWGSLITMRTDVHLQTAVFVLSQLEERGHLCNTELPKVHDSQDHYDMAFTCHPNHTVFSSHKQKAYARCTVFSICRIQNIIWRAGTSEF